MKLTVSIRGELDMEVFHLMNSMEDLVGIDGVSLDEQDLLDSYHALYTFMNSFITDLKSKYILEIRNNDERPADKYTGLDNSKNGREASNNGFKTLMMNYECCEPENLNECKPYEVIFLNHIIECTPVLDMEITWGKIKKALSPGGYIVLKTFLYENPNSANEYDSTHNIIDKRHHKQTFDTILRLCLKHGFIIASYKDNCFGLVKKNDLPLFDKSLQKIYMNSYKQIVNEKGFELKGSYVDEESEEAVTGPGRLLIGCVTENTKKYRDQTLRLVQSIRWFGGGISGADIFVCIVDEAEPKFVEELNKLGAFVRIVKRFSKVHPQSNKLRLFELAEIELYDTILLLDCDTVVVQDPSPFIDGKCFQAEIAAGPTVPHYIFKNLFSHFGLNLLPLEYKTTVTNTKTMIYCNAGVLIFPKKILQTFYPIWKEYTLNLIDNKHLLGKYFNFCEQASLTLAYADHPIPFRKLPLEMNFHLFESKLPKIKDCDPVIIHYHNSIDEGGLIIDKTSSLSAKNRVKQFNDRLVKYDKGEEQA
ncbi:hypothetical protein [Cytobacillus firmus]|uniref:hypothetical protein n=1 Tax=Cytobacillus firmus TaxID=1399 RepID=UPI0022283DFF|nr:hypothetical protein [Cytobacillus firmus]